MITDPQFAYIVHRTPATDYTPTDIFDARILKRPLTRKDRLLCTPFSSPPTFGETDWF